MVERLAGQVIRFEADRERLDHPLDSPNREHRTPDMLEENQPAAWAQHPLCLADGRLVIGDRAEGESDHDGVEALVGEFERLGVPLPQIDFAPHLLSTLATPPQHLAPELATR